MLKPFSSKRKQEPHLNSNTRMKQAGHTISEEPQFQSLKKRLLSKFYENPKAQKPKQNSKHPIQLEQQNPQDWKQETLNTPIKITELKTPGPEGEGSAQTQKQLERNPFQKRKKRKTNLGGEGWKRRAKRRRKTVRDGESDRETEVVGIESKNEMKLRGKGGGEWGVRRVKK